MINKNIKQQTRFFIEIERKEISSKSSKKKNQPQRYSYHDLFEPFNLTKEHNSKINQINKNLFDFLNQQSFGPIAQLESILVNKKEEMKYNSIVGSCLFVITICLLTTALGLRIQYHHHAENNERSHKKNFELLEHQQNDQPVYDEQRYLVDLAQRQNAFKQQVIEIQNDFAGINMMLNDSTLSKNQKTIKLSEALADQRDSLITAQKQLNLPYELKSCQCLNLTQQQKRELSAQLEKINKKIAQLQNASIDSNKHCEPDNCPLLQQLDNEIQMMKDYQSIMEMTINSKCCKVVKYEYKDNLDVSNWHWGNTTQSQYQAKIFQKQSVSDMKFQPCPYNLPWISSQNNTCFSCPTDKPLFNVGTRTCEKDCSIYSKNSAYVLNLTTHTCGYNKNCPSGQYFDETLRKCSKQPSYTNQSSCPPERPFWDPLSYSCQSCPSSAPYFDSTIKKCRQCNQNQTWNQQSRQCKSSQQQCGQGYYFDQTSKKCVIQRNDTHSLCPPERPFWNDQTYSCDQCGDDKPFYDKVQRTCRVCNEKQSFNQLTKECVPKSISPQCAFDEYFNSQTKQCQKRGTTSMCPPSTPYWDSINFKCLQCPSDKPLYNDKTLQCQQCLSNHSWSAKYKYCVPNCPFDEQWNHQYKRCIKINQTCPSKQAFSFDLNQCIEINCNETTPYWNSTANQCQPCPPGTVYNYVSGNCEKDSRTGNISVCQEDKPVWNADYLRCEPCPQGTSWDENQKTCISNPINTRHSHKLTQSVKSYEDFSHDSNKIEGHVYGNGNIFYQHHDLKDLQMKQ